MYGEDDGEVFLGHSVTKRKEVSEGTANIIDQEVRAIVDRNYHRAEQLLKDNLDKLHMMAHALIKYETIDSDQIDSIMSGKEPDPPKDWDTDDKSTRKFPAIDGSEPAIPSSTATDAGTTIAQQGSSSSGKDS